MKYLNLAFLASCLIFSSNQAMSEEDLCAPLQEKINLKMQSSVQKLAPRQSPSSYIQQNSDVEGILKQDVTSGFSKLMSLDFGSLATAIIDRGVLQASQKSNTAFNSQINGLLRSYGASPVANGTASSVNKIAPLVSEIKGLTTKAQTEFDGPYGRQYIAN